MPSATWKGLRNVRSLISMGPKSLPTQKAARASSTKVVPERSAIPFLILCSDSSQCLSIAKSVTKVRPVAWSSE